LEGKMLKAGPYKISDMNELIGIYNSSTEASVNANFKRTI